MRRGNFRKRCRRGAIPGGAEVVAGGAVPGSADPAVIDRGLLNRSARADHRPRLQLSAHQIFVGLSLADERKAMAPHQDLRRQRA